MPKENQSFEDSMGKDKHIVVLGAPFKPFERVRSYYQPPRVGETFEVPESYDHYLFLRKRVSLHGIDGVIDIIEEHPINFIEKSSVTARKFRLFLNQPFGYFTPVTKYLGEGKYDPQELATTLRFSFLLKNPAGYAKLLNTYGDVDLGGKRFLLTFNLNQRAIKRGFEALEQGKTLLVSEKNLFNMDELERMVQESNETGLIPSEAPPDEDPGRIAFVTFPQDIKNFRKIKVTFQRFDHDGQYPTRPVQPNFQPIPVLV